MPSDAARGCLLGLAVGDALGTTLEFTDPGPLGWDKPCTGPHREITGGGPFRLLPGQVTDDTQMAVCLADSLCDRQAFDLADVAQRYVAWSRGAFDIGGQTRSALARIGAGTHPMESGWATWVAGGRRAAGNGSLMRCAPLAVAFAGDLALLRRASLADSAITHADPRCMFAVAAFTAACAAGIAGANNGAMLAAAEAEVEPAGESLGGDARLAGHGLAAIEELRSDLAAAQGDDPGFAAAGMSITGAGQGFVRVAFRLAFWELAHAPDFRTGLLDVVNRGGDADTNGAIVGALLGARFGEFGIPPEWRLSVLSCSPPSPWGDVYHPRNLLALARE